MSQNCCFAPLLGGGIGKCTSFPTSPQEQDELCWHKLDKIAHSSFIIHMPTLRSTYTKPLNILSQTVLQGFKELPINPTDDDDDDEA